MVETTILKCSQRDSALEPFVPLFTNPYFHQMIRHTVIPYATAYYGLIGLYEYPLHPIPSRSHVWYSRIFQARWGSLASTTWNQIMLTRAACGLQESKVAHMHHTKDSGGQDPRARVYSTASSQP